MGRYYIKSIQFFIMVLYLFLAIILVYTYFSMFSDDVDAEHNLTTILWSDIADLSFLVNGSSHSIGLDFTLPLVVRIY